MSDHDCFEAREARWDVLFAEAVRKDSASLIDDKFPLAIFVSGAEWGAGWMAAVIGMAEAIRNRQPCSLCTDGGWSDEERRVCPRCDEPETSLDDDEPDLPPVGRATFKRPSK